MYLPRVSVDLVELLVELGGWRGMMRGGHELSAAASQRPTLLAPVVLCLWLLGVGLSHYHWSAMQARMEGTEVAYLWAGALSEEARWRDGSAAGNEAPRKP